MKQHESAGRVPGCQCPETPFTDIRIAERSGQDGGHGDGPQNRPAFFIRSEFADMIRCSVRKLDRLAHTDPRFPKKIKHGRTTLFAADDVRRYLSELAQQN